MTQGQLSRVENGPPIVHLDRLVQWARLLRIPPRHLWFAMPPELPGEATEQSAVKRSEFLAWSGAVLAGAAIAPLGGSWAYGDVEACARLLAWELWRSGQTAIRPSELPAPLAARLARLAAGQLAVGSLILVDHAGRYGFAHPALVDVFVAQRIFAEIAEGDSRLFATAQTTHDTDHVIRRYVRGHDAAAGWLGRWMTRGATPVLRVNAAGVLAKVGDPGLGDRVITTLRADEDSRHLYLTAVLARVAAVEWDEAQHLAAAVISDGSPLPADRVTDLAFRFAGEIGNHRDSAARWCATLVLARAGQAGADVAYPALRTALAAEPCKETLRGVAAALAGQNPITV
jgi:hypothetical protein